MTVRRVSWIGLAALCVALSSIGCAEKQAAPDPNAKTEAQLQQEAAAARMKEEATALEQRAAQMQQAARDVANEVAEDAPGTLAASVETVRAKAAEVEQLTSALAEASGEGWDGAKARLEAALGELDQVRGAAAQAAAQWRDREAQAAAARADGKSPINPDTGLIEGLDGGQYEQYLVSVVEKVQLTLRRKGLYAGPADGVFDMPTLQAVGEFQAQESLQKSGVPSPMTRGRLFSDGA